MERRAHPRCSFCGKTQDQVRKLVSGPGVFICDQCIELCNEVIKDDAAPTAKSGFARASHRVGSARSSRRDWGSRWLRRLFRIEVQPI